MFGAFNRVTYNEPALNGSGDVDALSAIVGANATSSSYAVAPVSAGLSASAAYFYTSSGAAATIAAGIAAVQDGMSIVFSAVSPLVAWFDNHLSTFLLKSKIIPNIADHKGSVSVSKHTGGGTSVSAHDVTTKVLEH